MTQTLVALWTAVRRRLEVAGVETPVFDARLLVESGARVSRLDIITDPRRMLTDAQIAAVDALAQRRAAREPVGHILGHKQFWTLDLAVSPAVLIPRPETELVVETALAQMPESAPLRVLDLGVGSGAILLALLSERPLAEGVGVDLSADALAVAQANARTLALDTRVSFRQGDWATGLDEQFDIIVSNPPYIVSSEIAQLAPEVARFEPHVALDGGGDGLDAYRAITAALPALLKHSGAFFLEVGAGQADAVRALAESRGLVTGSPKLDLAGIPRVVSGGRAA